MPKTPNSKLFNNKREFNKTNQNNSANNFSATKILKSEKIYKEASNMAESFNNEYDRDGHSLYIYNLASTTNEEGLWKVFSPFGAIKKIVVMRDSESNLSRGFAFVDMKNLEDAVLAIEILNGTELNGRQLRINFKGQKNDDDHPFGEPGAYQLYVYNIPSDINEVRLFKLFGQFGGVKNVAIIKDRVKNSGSIAFVTMRKKEDAEKAIQTLNGFGLENHILQVRFKNQKGEAVENIKENPSNAEVQLYINNLDHYIEDQAIWKLFAHFGAIKDVNVMRDTAGKCIGYGFVTMKEMDAATVAVNTLNGTALSGRNLNVSFKTKKSK